MTSSAECAHEVLDVVPRVMQVIRTAIRQQRDSELSVLQLRALAYLHHQPGAPLSTLAEHVGLTLPSMSSQVSGLVARDLVNRSVSTEDRRYVTLTLTEKGEQTFLKTLKRAEQDLAHMLEQLEPHERTEVVQSLALLTRICDPLGQKAREQGAMEPELATGMAAPHMAQDMAQDVAQARAPSTVETNNIANDVTGSAPATISNS